MKGEKKNRQRRFIRVIKWVTIITVIGIFILLDFYSNVNSSIKTNVLSNLSNSVEYDINNFSTKINDKINYLNIIGNIIGKTNDYSKSDMINILQSISKDSNLFRVSGFGIDGVGLASNGDSLDISEEEYFKEAIKGNEYISNVIKSRFIDEEAIVIAAPIIKNSEVTGVLTGTILISDIKEVMKLHPLEDAGTIKVFDEYGQAIITTNDSNDVIESKNFFRFLEECNLSDKNNSRSVMDDINNLESGWVKYNYLNENYYMQIKPINVGGWFAVGVAREELIKTPVRNVYRATFKLLYHFLIFVGILTFILIIKILIETKRVKVSEERYKIITEQSDGIIFEHSLIDSSIKYSEKYIKIFGDNPIEHNFPHSLVRQGIIHEDDGEKVIESYNRCKAERVTECLEIRVRKSNMNYIWCRVTMTTLLDDFNIPLKIIGFIVDIDVQKKKELKLIKKAMKDPLTSLYNKGATELLISNYLLNNSGNLNAFMIIDIDDFKGINDTYGHLAGDNVLINISKLIKDTFDKSAITGRIGGDEFVVFIKDVKDIEKIEEYSKLICTMFREQYLYNNHKIKLSGSVGVAISPEYGKDFNELYKNADIALYNAKNSGKDCYHILK